MNGMIFGENEAVIPVLAPVTITTSETNTKFVALRDANWITFVVQWGLLTSDSTDTVNFQVVSSTANTTNSGDVDLPFVYREFAAVGTDDLGAITTSSTAGVTVTATTADSMGLIIDVDPAVVFEEDSDAKYVYVRVTPSGFVGACPISALAIVRDRYPGNDIPGTS